MKHEPPIAEMRQTDITELRAVRGALRVRLCALAAWLIEVLPHRMWLGAALRVVISAHLHRLERDVRYLAFDFAWLNIVVRGHRCTAAFAAIDPAPPGFRRACRRGSRLRHVTRGIFRGQVGIRARLTRLRRALDDIERLAARVLRRLVRRVVTGRLLLTARPAVVLRRIFSAAGPAGADTS